MARRRDRRSANRDVDVALLFTTDPDDRRRRVSSSCRTTAGLQPAENVTPIVRDEVVDEFGPRAVDRSNEVSERLTTDVLRELNEQVAHGDSPRAVASRWLTAQGLR